MSQSSELAATSELVGTEGTQEGKKKEYLPCISHQTAVTPKGAPSGYKKHRTLAPNS